MKPAYFIIWFSINPIPAGVLENQDTLEGRLTPLSKSHVRCPNMTNDTSLESSCALLLEIAKNFANLQKMGQNKDLVCYRKKQSFRQCA